MILDILFLAAIAFGMVYNLLLTIESWWTIHRRSPRPVLVGSPGITVFKPLKGVDDALEANLRSFFEQDYPRFQLLFGVQDADDPVIGIVEKLLRAYPQVRARLVVDGTETGLNPKINNLCNMYPYARHPHLLISDSNVRVGRDYLRGMMAALQQDGVGLVTSTIRGVGARSIGALMENLHLNTFVAGSVWIAEHLADMPIAIGKSMLFSRGTLERIGGFAAFREFLAEDYLIGEAVADLGLRVTTLTAAVGNVNRNWTLARFCNRHARWARSARRSIP
jgi:ceramide glucosyltransferase